MQQQMHLNLCNVAGAGRAAASLPLTLPSSCDSKEDDYSPASSTRMASTLDDFGSQQTGQILPEVPSRPNRPKKASKTSRRRTGRKPVQATFSEIAPATISPEACGKYIDELRKGGAAAQEIVKTLTGRFATISFEKDGCRLVQEAIEAVDSAVASSIAKELRGHIIRACDSPNANYVVQKMIKALPPPSVSFVAEELLGNGVEVAKNMYGCRIICRILEFSPASHSSARLISEVLDRAAELMQHTFGHHVIQSALENGTNDQKHRILETIRDNIDAALANRNAGFVLDRALTHGSMADVTALAQLILKKESRLLVSMAFTQVGAIVVKNLATLNDRAHYHKVRRALESSADAIEGHSQKWGKKLLEELQKMEPDQTGCRGFASRGAWA